jgi:septum formation protein
VTKQNLILASRSARRKSLLEQIGIDFEIISSDVPEPPFSSGSPATYAEVLARTKALPVANSHPSRPVLGADTIVIIGHEVLGKPVDEADAKRMLRRLSGNWHEVITAVSLLHINKNYDQQEHEVTRVHFRDITDFEIDTYIATKSPFDKAGAYGIQDYSGIFVDRIEGCFYNVVGLPLSRTNALLSKIL